MVQPSFNNINTQSWINHEVHQSDDRESPDETKSSSEESWVEINNIEHPGVSNQRVESPAMRFFASLRENSLNTLSQVNDTVTSHRLVRENLAVSTSLSAIQHAFWVPIFQNALFKNYMSQNDQLCHYGRSGAPEEFKEKMKQTITQLAPYLNRHTKESVWNHFFAPFVPGGISSGIYDEVFTTIKQTLLNYQKTSLEEQYLRDWHRIKSFRVIDHKFQETFTLKKGGTSLPLNEQLQLTPPCNIEEFTDNTQLVAPNQQRDDDMGRNHLDFMNPGKERDIRDLICLACSQSINAATNIFTPILETQWAINSSLKWDINDRGHCDLHLFYDESGTFTHADAVLLTTQRLLPVNKDILYSSEERCPDMGAVTIELLLHFRPNENFADLSSLPRDAWGENILNGYSYTLSGVDWKISNSLY